MSFDEADRGPVDLEPFLGLTEAEADRELSADDPVLRELLAEITRPPDDLAVRINRRTREQLLRRRVGFAVIDLLTVGVPTAKAIMLEPEGSDETES